MPRSVRHVVRRSGTLYSDETTTGGRKLCVKKPATAFRSGDATRSPDGAVQALKGFSHHFARVGPNLGPGSPVVPFFGGDRYPHPP
jgi:hypothetical protein